MKEKQYFYHDGNDWVTEPHTKEDFARMGLPFHTTIVEAGKNFTGEPMTIGDLFPSYRQKPASKSAGAALTAPASRSVSSAELVVLKDIAHNLRIITVLTVIPWILAGVGFVLYMVRYWQH